MFVLFSFNYFTLLKHAQSNNFYMCTVLYVYNIDRFDFIFIYINVSFNNTANTVIP